LGHGGRIADLRNSNGGRACLILVVMPSKKRTTLPTESAPQGPASRKRLKLEVLSSKVVYQGSVFRVTSDRVREPNGITARRDVVRHSGSVVVLAVEESAVEPCVLLERQYRYAANQYLWELPAGRIDGGESALAGAKRELLEETGYRAREWKRALFFYPSPGFVDETMTIYLARGLTAGEAQPEEDESIECKLTPLTRAVGMVVSGRIRDGKTIAGVLWLAEWIRQN
jgi:ADP-ribose diphosphatase